MKMVLKLYTVLLYFLNGLYFLNIGVIGNYLHLGEDSRSSILLAMVAYAL